MVNPWQTSNENTKEDVCHLVFSDYLVLTSKYSKAHCFLHYQCFFLVLSKKTKTSCEDDVLSLVDEEIESLSKKKGKKSSSSVKTTPSTSRTSSR
jgi:hypothetical protein